MSKQKYRIEVAITTVTLREAWFLAESEDDARALAKADQANWHSQWQEIGDDTTDFTMEIEECETDDDDTQEQQ